MILSVGGFKRMGKFDGEKRRRNRSWCPLCVRVQYDVETVEVCIDCAHTALAVDRVLGQIYRLNPQLQKHDAAVLIRKIWNAYCGLRKTFRPIPETRPRDREPVHAIREDSTDVF